MKQIFILTFLSVSTMLGVPVEGAVPHTRLPDGEFNFECTQLRVLDVDGFGQRRESSQIFGLAVIKSNGDKSSYKEVSTQIMGGFVVGTSEDSTEISVEDLGNSQFEEISTSVSRFTPDGSASADPDETIVSKRVFEVAGQFEINLKVQVGTAPEKPGVGETLIGKTSDGAFTTVSYIREPYRREVRKLANGSEVAAAKVLQSTTSCIYRLK